MRSAFVQVGVETDWEIVVVDNAPEAPAKRIVEQLRPLCPAPLTYVHEPRPGVATARNAGLCATGAGLIAFLDDDQEASPEWLAALLATRENFRVDAVFGPVKGAPEAPPELRSFLETFFSRGGASVSGLLSKPFGCGNSLLMRATALPGAEPFDPVTDQVGGEDDRVFAALSAKGGKFGWAADALVTEHVPRHRSNLSFALQRAFRYGQAPTQAAALAGARLKVAGWMLVGAAQSVLYGVKAVVLVAIASPLRAAALNRLAQGLGKMFWARSLQPMFYGAAELDRSQRELSTGQRPFAQL
jgi:hypothetical protein